jgi:hypothetical protein
MLILIIISLFYSQRENYTNTSLSDWQNVQTDFNTLFDNGISDLNIYPIFTSSQISNITQHRI